MSRTIKASTPRSADSPRAVLVADVIAQQEVEERGPRRRVHDADGESPLRQQPGESRFRAAPVAIRIHVGRERHGAARDEVFSQRRDGVAAGRWDIEVVCWVTQWVGPSLKETAPVAGRRSER